MHLTTWFSSIPLNKSDIFLQMSKRRKKFKNLNMLLASDSQFKNRLWLKTMQSAAEQLAVRLEVIGSNWTLYW